MAIKYFKIRLHKAKAAWVRPLPFVQQICESLLALMRVAPKNYSQEAIRNFFQNHREKEPDPFVFDGSTDGYCQQIIPILPDSMANQYMDLGCGSAKLYDFLNSRLIPFRKYVGVDFAPTSSQSIYRLDFEIINTTIQDESIVELALPGTHLVFINSICYQDRLDKILLLQHAARSRENSLIIVEPFPGIFWDKHFSGIRPKYRSMPELIGELENMGWRLQKQAIFYLFKLGPLWIWPLTYAVSFDSTKHEFEKTSER